jgi:hypothetical protein
MLQFSSIIQSERSFHDFFQKRICMGDIVSDVVAQREHVQRLYNLSAGLNNPSMEYLNWRDEHKLRISNDDLIKDSSEIASTDQILDAVISYYRGISNSNLLKSSGCLLSFSYDGKIPKVGLPCPTIKEISKLLSDENLIVLVYSQSGYNFSSEFNLVYKSAFRSVTAYEDLVSVIQKALWAADPALTKEICAQYAIYILVRISWDTIISVEMFHQILSTKYSKVQNLKITSVLLTKALGRFQDLYHQK